MYSRRELGALALGVVAAPLAGGFASVAGGVRLGVHTNSFRNLPRTPGRDPIETLIQALVACEARECELLAPQVEAQFGGAHGGHHAMSSMSPQMVRRELRKWRLRTPLSYFETIGSRFQKAGIAIYAYNYSPNPSFSDEEIDRGFGMAKALGAEIITASTTLDVAKRIAPFAERHRMIVSLHGHSRVGDPNELATPRSLDTAMTMSKYFKVNLDIGDFTAANLDAVSYIREHHADITSLQLKDRRKNQGGNVPWGQGDTPIVEVLQLLKREAWPIRAFVELEYAGQASPVDEVRKCLAYANQALTVSRGTT
jgi:sugar phosphate isomerase/epimerase